MANFLFLEKKILRLKKKMLIASRPLPFKLSILYGESFVNPNQSIKVERDSVQLLHKVVD
jgi:hypothetical protein